MNFDTVRAWKDESYRQSLSEEQISNLPANPAGELELSAAELESVNGGAFPGGLIPGFGGIGGGGGAAGGSSSASSNNQQEEERRVHFHSATIDGNCNERVFSITFIHGFNFLSPNNAFCINDED